MLDYLHRACCNNWCVYSLKLLVSGEKVTSPSLRPTAEMLVEPGQKPILKIDLVRGTADAVTLVRVYDHFALHAKTLEAVKELISLAYRNSAVSSAMNHKRRGPHVADEGNR